MEYRNLIFWESDLNTSVENVLQYFLSESLQDDADIENLSESVKFSQFSKVFRRVLDSIRNKTDIMDFRDIDRSKGDIEKIEGYKNFKEAMRQLRQANSRKDSILFEIDNLHSNILKYKNEFKKSYNDISFTGQCLYRSAVYTYFYAVSMYLATCIVVEVPQANAGRVEMKVDVKREMEKTFAFQSVRKLNKYFSDGKIKTFFRKDVSSDNGADFIDKIKNSNVTPVKSNFALSSGALISGIIIGLPIAILGIIFLIREIIFYFYKFRKYLANEFSIAAEYLELNAELQDNKTTRKKQLEIAERYRKIADKIRVKSDMVTKQVEKEIKKELVQDNKYAAEKGTLADKMNKDDSDIEQAPEEHIEAEAPPTLF
jgi:hypothetical protein